MAGGSDQEIFELKQRIALLEARIGQLYAHLDLKPLPHVEPTEDPEITQALADGDEMRALKRYRELTGASMSEAKQALDELKPS